MGAGLETRTADCAAVEPFEYNPSRWRQRIPICLLAAVGFVISTYLALYQWRLISSAWDPFFGSGTEKVLDSGTSETMRLWLHLPDAGLGAIAYLGDAIYGLAGSTRRWQYRPWMVIIFGLDVIPLGVVSAVLVVMQGAVVGEWCTLCLFTAGISLILVWLAYDEVWCCLVYLYRVRKRNRKALWKTVWGSPTPEGIEVGREMCRRA